MDHVVCRVFGILLVMVTYSAYSVEGADVAYGLTCTDGSDSCIGTGSHACIDSVCACATTAFRNNANDECVTKSAFELACDNTVTATDQCAVANQACTVETGTTYKCLCTAAYYSDGSSACVARKKPDETCAANQCVEHATCDAVSSPTKCECDTGYTATPTASPTMCSGVVNLASLSYMYVVPILVSMMSLLR